MQGFLNWGRASMGEGEKFTRGHGAMVTWPSL